MAITKDQALSIDCVHATGQYDSHGNCRIWRRNGRTQTWKRTPASFRLPVKYGLYRYDAVTEATTSVHAPEDCPQLTPEQREECRQQRLASIERAQRREHFDQLVTSKTIVWSHDHGWWQYATTGQPYEVSREQLTGWHWPQANLT